MIEAELDAGISRLVLDLRDVSFCDSTGLSCLLRANRSTRSAGGWLRLAGMAGQPARILELTKLDETLPTFADVDAAVSASS